MGGGVLRARGDRLSEVDRLEDGLGVIEDGRFGDLLFPNNPSWMVVKINLTTKFVCKTPFAHSVWIGGENLYY